MTDSDFWGECIPGRPDDWPALKPIDPEQARELAAWASAYPVFHELAFALLDEADAVENEDRDAWFEALERQSRSRDAW